MWCGLDLRGSNLMIMQSRGSNLIVMLTKVVPKDKFELSKELVGMSSLRKNKDTSFICIGLEGEI